MYIVFEGKCIADGVHRVLHFTLESMIRINTLAIVVPYQTSILMTPELFSSNSVARKAIAVVVVILVM